MDAECFCQKLCLDIDGFPNKQGLFGAEINIQFR